MTNKPFRACLLCIWNNTLPASAGHQGEESPPCQTPSSWDPSELSDAEGPCCVAGWYHLEEWAGPLPSKLMFVTIWRVVLGTLSLRMALCSPLWAPYSKACCVSFPVMVTCFSFLSSGNSSRNHSLLSCLSLPP